MGTQVYAAPFGGELPSVLDEPVLEPVSDENAQFEEATLESVTEVEPEEMEELQGAEEMLVEQIDGLTKVAEKVEERSLLKMRAGGEAPRVAVEPPENYTLEPVCPESKKKRKRKFCDAMGPVERPMPGKGAYVGAGARLSTFGAGATIWVAPHPSVNVGATYLASSVMSAVSAELSLVILPMFGVRARVSPTLQVGYLHGRIATVPGMLDDVLGDWVSDIGIDRSVRGLKFHFVTATGGFDVFLYSGLKLRFYVGYAHQLGKGKLKGDSIYTPQINSAQLPMAGFDVILMPEIGKWIQKAPRKGQYFGMGALYRFPFGVGPSMIFAPHPAFDLDLFYGTSTFTRSVGVEATFNPLEAAGIHFPISPILKVGYVYSRYASAPKKISGLISDQLPGVEIESHARGAGVHWLVEALGVDVALGGLRLRFYGGFTHQMGCASSNKGIYGPSLCKAKFALGGVDAILMVPDPAKWRAKRGERKQSKSLKKQRRNFERAVKKLEKRERRRSVR